MMTHCGLLRQALINTLKNAGAKRYEVYRTPKDANDQPIGEAVKIASVFGLYHQKMSDGGLRIEIAGTIISQSSAPQLTCVKLEGETPRQGDFVKIGEQNYEVLAVTEKAAALVLQVKE